MNNPSTFKRRAMAGLFCALVAALPPSMPLHAQNLPTLGDTERQDLSPVMERRLGEQIMHDIRRNIDYLDDAPTLEYLDDFGGELLAARPDARGEAGYDYFFFAVRDPYLNAFALPGGFIGVHSALVLAAQTESELASVIGHEIGHVAQRHIARMLGKQKQDAIIPLAAAILAALASRAGGDAATAVLMGGQGLAIQRQLNFSRAAEREADRVGFQILQAAGYDTSGAAAFFGRMQTATRAYSDSVPAYLRSHPLTTERMADMEARNRGQRYRQRVDSLDFHLIRARLRVLQDESAAGRRDAEATLRAQAGQPNWQQVAAARYGLAFLALREGRLQQAAELLHEARLAAARAPAPTPRLRPVKSNAAATALSPMASRAAALVASAGIDTSAPPVRAAGSAAEAAGLPVFSGGAAAPGPALGGSGAVADNAIFAALETDIALARGLRGSLEERQAAVRTAEAAHQKYPLSRGIARQYADALMGAGRHMQAATYLREQLQLYRHEPQLHERLAQVYAATGKLALQHMALAESYALTGATQAALEQLGLARKAGDASYYDHSVIDARERELQARRREEIKEEKERS